MSLTKLTKQAWRSLTWFGEKSAESECSDKSNNSKSPSCSSSPTVCTDSSTSKDDDCDEVMSSRPTRILYDDEDDGGFAINVQSTRAMSLGGSQKVRWTRARKQAYCLFAVVFTAFLTGLAFVIRWAGKPPQLDVGLYLDGTTSEEGITADLIVRMKTIRELMVKGGVSTLEDLSTRETPQHRALHWISYRDDIPLTEVQRLTQRYVLAVLYYSTSGDKYWNRRNDFLSKDHECKWNNGAERGAFCHETCISVSSTAESEALFRSAAAKNVDGSTSSCKPGNTIETLNIGNMNATGSIPGELGSLSFLTKLHFGINQLEGSVPSELGKLQHLNALSFTDNLLSGEIPSELGQLTNLVELSISRNFFEGELPESLTQLSRMTTFPIYSNDLTGNLDRICYSWPNLKQMTYDCGVIECSCPECVCV